MEYSTIFFVIVLLFIAVTFIVEVVKPKLEVWARNRKFKNRDYTKDEKIREQRAKQQQDEHQIISKEKHEQVQQQKALKALEDAEKYLLNPHKYKNARTIDEVEPKTATKVLELRQRKKLVDEKAKRKERAQALRDQLEDEPISTPETASLITSISMRIPNRNKPLQRKFLSTDTLQKLVNFIDSTELLDTLNYSLVTPYPTNLCKKRKKIDNEQVTLKECCKT